MSLVVLGLIALSAFGGNIAVIQKWDDSVSLYDSSTGESLAKIAAGRKPHEFAFSPDRRLAYITNYGADRWTDTSQGENTITIVDLKERRKVGQIDLGQLRRPHGIQRGQSGKLYVTCDFPPTVIVVDPASQKVLESIDVGQSLPHMVVVTSNEQMAYTANAGAESITAIDLKQGKAVAHVTVGGVPMGLALPKDEGKLYVANRMGNAVVVIDTRSNTVVARMNIPGHPARLLLLPDNRHMAASLIDSGEVAIISLEDQKEVNRFKVGDHPEGMAVDAAKKVFYISAQADNKVLQFSLDGWKKVLEIQTPPRPDPIAILD